MPFLSPAVWGSLPFGNTLVVSSGIVLPPTPDGFLKGGCGSYKMSVKSLIFFRSRGLDNMTKVMLCNFQGSHKRQCSWFVGICKPVVLEPPCKKLPPWNCHAGRKPKAVQVERPWNYKQRDAWPVSTIPASWYSSSSHWLTVSASPSRAFP